jgi:hypothetical protein
MKKLVIVDCDEGQLEQEVEITMFDDDSTTTEKELGEILESIWENRDNVIFHKKLNELIKISKV